MPMDVEGMSKHGLASDQPKPAKVERGAPLYQQIQLTLWEKIASGGIAPGEHLSDRVVAEELGVSRTPVREAMRQLACDGVLITLGNGGYQLRPVDRAGLLDLYVCRSVLAGAAVRLTTERGDKKLIKRLRAVMAHKGDALRRRDAEAIMTYASQFHRAIIEGSNNAYLIDVMGRLSKMILFYRINLLKKSLRNKAAFDAYLIHLEKAHMRHTEIISAMDGAKAALASKLMEQHLIETSKDMDQILAAQCVDDSP